MRRETYKKSEVTVGRKIKLPNVTDRTRKKKSTKTPNNWKNIYFSYSEYCKDFNSSHINLQI